MPASAPSPVLFSGTQRYPGSLRALHWTMFVLVAAQLAVGLYMHELPDEAPLKFELFKLHAGSGVVLLALIALRILLRVSSRTPGRPSGLSPLEWTLARVGHFLLYCCLVVMPVTGYLMTAAYPESSGIPFFGIELPPVIGHDKALSELLGEIHEICAFTLMALVVLHVAAALKHRFFDAAGSDFLRRII